jgi:hypothetical protein
LGEFGGTPRISAQVGRDHCPQANCALLCGDGMKTVCPYRSTLVVSGTHQRRPLPCADADFGDRAGLEQMLFEVGQPVEPGAGAPSQAKEYIERLLAAAPKYGIEIKLPRT